MMRTAYELIWCRQCRMGRGVGRGGRDQRATGDKMQPQCKMKSHLKVIREQVNRSKTLRSSYPSSLALQYFAVHNLSFILLVTLRLVLT